MIINIGTEEIDGIVYRDMNVDDVDAFMNLLEKVGQTVMGIQLSNRFDKIRENYFNRHSNSDPHIIRGAFKDGNLVVTVSGSHISTYNHWYQSGHFSSLSATSSEFLDVSFKLMKPVHEYYERIGYYSFYTLRTIRHQTAWDKIHRMKSVSEHIIKYGDRYNHFWDTIYPKHTECHNTNHKAFFVWRKTIPLDTVVVCHSLKQEYRLERVKERYGEVSDELF